MFAFLTKLLLAARFRLKSRTSLEAKKLGSASAADRFKPASASSDIASTPFPSVYVANT